MLQSGEWDDAAAINLRQNSGKTIFFGYIDIKFLFLQALSDKTRRYTRRKKIHFKRTKMALVHKHKVRMGKTQTERKRNETISKKDMFLRVKKKNVFTITRLMRNWRNTEKKRPFKWYIMTINEWKKIIFPTEDNDSLFSWNRNEKRQIAMPFLSVHLVDGETKKVHLLHQHRRKWKRLLAENEFSFFYSKHQHEKWCKCLRSRNQRILFAF